MAGESLEDVPERFRRMLELGGADETMRTTTTLSFAGSG